MLSGFLLLKLKKKPCPGINKRPVSHQTSQRTFAGSSQRRAGIFSGCQSQPWGWCALPRSQGCDACISSYTLSGAAAAWNEEGGETTSWEQFCTPRRKAASHLCTAHRQSSSEDEADLHVVRRTAVIVRHDSGRFTPDVLPETAGELISQPERARCFLFRSRAQKGNELLLKKGEVKKGDGPSWAGRLLSHAAGSAALTHMELYK